jgi:hypothetical protein
MHRIPIRQLLTCVACLSFSANPAPVTSSQFQYFASAFGSSANVADTVLAGRTALVQFGACGTLRTPQSAANTVATVNALPIAATGVVNTSISATDASRTQASSARAVVSTASLLSGLVRAREVRAVSVTSHDRSGFHTSAAGSGFVDLVVAGVPIVLFPGPNTRINLPGVGHVVLNEQIPQIGATSASFTVSMIHIVVSVANPLAPVGANIIVARAVSALVPTNMAGTLDGHAYGTLARAANVILSGRSAPIELGCSGTNGAVRTESVAQVVARPELLTGLVVDTASGVANSTSATGETTSTVQAVDVLSSLVTVDAVRADAHSFTDGRVFTFTDTGSSFVNLAVRGFPAITDQVAPNTSVSIDGLGTLWLKREIFTPNSIEIRMIELAVDRENAFGLPVGARIQVAVAHASAH